MVTQGLIVRLEAKAGKAKEIEEFLESALELVRQEPATTAWFAVRFGRSGETRAPGRHRRDRSGRWRSKARAGKRCG